MPEGDTIAKLAARVRGAVGGQTVLSCITRDPRLENVHLTGNQLIDVGSVGKFLMLRFSNGQTLYSHLGMDGEWVVGNTPRVPAWQRRCELGFAEATLTAVEMPKIGLIATADEATLTADLGPDLCAPTPPDAAVVAQRLATNPDTPLAAAMLDQHLVAGWGNVFAVEIPYIMGLDPAHPVGDVAGLIDLAQIGTALIRWSADGHPRNTTGRRIQRFDYFVYDSATGICPVCGSALIASDAGDTEWKRRSWRCPVCQAPDHDQADMTRARRMLALHPAMRTLTSDG